MQDAKPHEIDGGDSVCGDCLWCEENDDRDCPVADDQKCVWCGHCLVITLTHPNVRRPHL